MKIGYQQIDQGTVPVRGNTRLDVRLLRRVIERSGVCEPGNVPNVIGSDNGAAINFSDPEIRERVSPDDASGCSSGLRKTSPELRNAVGCSWI
jgi:hypothetical protein